MKNLFYDLPGELQLNIIKIRDKAFKKRIEDLRFANF